MRWLAVIALVASCYRDARDEQLERRLARIEQRLDAHDKALASARARADTTELALLAQRLTELQQTLAQLNAALPQAPATPPRRVADKAATYAVPLGASPQLGPANAKITLVMAMEFDCPFCRKAWDTLDELRKRYSKDLRVVYRAYVVHKRATYAAQAACAANRQGRWRALADLIWAKAFDVRSVDTDAFSPARIDALAKEAGLDIKRYTADVTGPCPAEVAADIAELKKFGTNATPTFFINGRYMDGAKPIAEFAKLIEEELAKATAAVKRGVKPERYYEQEVLGKGLPEASP